MKRKIEILKSYEEFDNRLRTATWDSPKADINFRLQCLIGFNPNLKTRQLFNLAKTNIKDNLK